MIEQGMYFLLGLLMAALGAMALLPALWRRAVRLTRARLEATLPLTPDEIAAEKDQLRAVHAVDIRRMETAGEAASLALQQAKAEIGARTALIQRHEAELEARAGKLAAFEEALAAANAAIAGHEETIATLERERDNLATTLSSLRIAGQALDQEAQNLRQIGDQRQARIGDLELHADAVAARLAEATGAIAALREESQARLADLRAAARQMREDAAQKSLLERKLAATEALAEDRAATLERVQDERLKLIDELGHMARDRDHERVERNAGAARLEAVTSRLAEVDGAAVSARDHHGQTVLDLTRTIDRLKHDLRRAEDELSSLRFTRARLETDLARLAKARAEPQEAALLPPPPPAPEPAEGEAAPTAQAPPVEAPSAPKPPRRTTIRVRQADPAGGA